MDLRGTPRLGRTLAVPLGWLAAAALGGVLGSTVLPPDRRVVIAVAAAAVLGVYELVRAGRLLSRQRRAADDWLRTATGRFVAPAYAWRARQLCSARERRMLARTLRLVVQSAYERPVGRRRPLHLPAVRAHEESVHTLARALETLDEPVTPAGMLRVADLVSDGASPLWGTTKDAPLGAAIETTLALLRPGARGSACAA